MLEGQKVVTAIEMARIEKQSLSEGASAEAYMQRAAEGITQGVKDFVERHRLEKKVTLLIGKGNNGADALLVGKLLIKEHFFIKAYHFFPLNECSPLCQKESAAFLAEGGELHFPQGVEELHFFPQGTILDGLMGIGLKKEVEGLVLLAIEKANASKLPILSIDIPSGLCGNTGKAMPAAIKARETFFLGLPKIGFFLERGYDHIGALKGVDFGLDLKYLHAVQAEAHLINEKSLPALLPPLLRTQHKYQAGYVCALASSPGMPGAGMLATLAALRAGAGIVRLFHLEGMEKEFSKAPHELVRTPYTFKDFSQIELECKRAGACLIGPGLGKSAEMGQFLRSLVPKLSIPLVIDADGLYHLKDHFSSIQVPCVITPHKKEMLHLLGKESFACGEFFPLCQAYADAHQISIVYKGAPTFLFHPNHPPLIINRGDPGMATAGTGDVLTGMIAALFAKKMHPRDAAALGVYLHALAGEFAAKKRTSYDVIASDLIDSFSDAVKSIQPI